MVFGWDQAISWDGRQVTPLLTDACRHLLVLLTQAAVPTAVTLHMENLDRQPREVFTFFSGSNVVTLDSRLRVRLFGLCLTIQHGIFICFFMTTIYPKIR